MRFVLVIGSCLLSLSAAAQGLRADTAALKPPLNTFVSNPAFGQQVPVIPQNQSTRNFGFFCKQELKMQRANIPVTFRLGSMEYVNKMEGKTHP